MYKRIICKDGFNVSVQGHSRNYCSPRDNFGPYTTVELGMPSAIDSLIIEYADQPDRPTDTVYGYVPVGIVKALLIKHEGIVSGNLPPFNFTPEQSAILADALEKINNESR